LNIPFPSHGQSIMIWILLLFRSPVSYFSMFIMLIWNVE